MDQNRSLTRRKVWAKRVISSLYRNDCGQDIVESALVLPLLLLFLFGIADFGLVMMNYNTVANAAREGARAGILSTNPTCDIACRDSAAIVAAQRLTTGLDPAELTIVVVRPVVGTVQVHVTYNARLMTGIVVNALSGQNTITLRSIATMQREDIL